jgi:hypothetical protein
VLPCELPVLVLVLVEPLDEVEPCCVVEPEPLVGWLDPAVVDVVDGTVEVPVEDEDEDEPSV